MSVFETVDASNFEMVVLKSDRPYVLEFGATWCQPCKRLEPELEKLQAGLNGKVKFGQVDVDSSADLAAQFGVMGVPTVIVFDHGSAHGRLTGYQPLRKLEELVSAVTD